MRKVYRFFGWVFTVGAVGLWLFSATERYTEWAWTVAAVVSLLLSSWCFWFARFIGRVEALEDAANAARGKADV